MIPLVLITGFLGSGKTTLVRQLAPLLRNNNVELHYILNDYGDASIDAETLRDQVASLADITGSCVCCEGIDIMLSTLAQLKPKGRAVIVIEANGTSDVPSLLEMLVMSRSTRHCLPPVQVAVVDAQLWQERDWMNDLELEQVQAASLVVFTHQDLVSEQRLSEVHTQFQRQNASAQALGAEELAARLTMQARLAAVSTPPPSRGHTLFELESKHTHDHDHISHRFSAVELTLKPRVDRLDLIHCLATLPATILRAKGIVCFEDDDEGFSLVQRADPRCDVSLLRMSRLKPAASMMVLIGAALDAQALHQRFSHLQLMPSATHDTGSA